MPTDLEEIDEEIRREIKHQLGMMRYMSVDKREALAKSICALRQALNRPQPESQEKPVV